jgi:hypothetical protein
MRKKELLNHWAGLKPGLPLKPQAIRYKHEGSTYGHDGIRIEGSPEFIDGILSRLQDLLAYENADTRLGVAYSQVTAKPGKGHSGGDHVCYVKFHERGNEARAMNHAFGAVTYRPPRAA